jgi:proteic killer suppression protein
LEIKISFSIFAASNSNIMQLQFEHEYLKDLYYEGGTTDKSRRFQPEVIRGYVKGVKYLEKATTISELYWHGSLHFEPLKGNKRGLYSIRANDKYRVEFKILPIGQDHSIVRVCRIVDLSNHYKK